MGAILLVVGDAGAPTSSDNLVKGWLEVVGQTVTLRSDETADDVTGFDGVVITESVSSATIASKYDTAAVPVITHEPGNVNNLRLFSQEAGSYPSSQDQITIAASSHPIADGPYGSFTGSVFFASGLTNIAIADDDVGDFPAGVTVVAALAVDAPSKAILAAESGATLTSGTAPAKRAFIFPSTTAAALLNANGIAIVKNAYAWAFLTAEQTILPDADIAAGGWTTTPLFSKLNDGSDATVITATAV